MADALPDDLWVSLSDWSGNPNLAAVDRRRRALLRFRIVAGSIHQPGDARALEAAVSAAGPVRACMLRLPAGLAPWPDLERRALERLSVVVPPPCTLERPTLEEGDAPNLVAWWRPAAPRLRILELSVAQHSLMDRGFVDLWRGTVGALPWLESLTLDVSGNGLGDEALEGLEAVALPPRLTFLTLNLADNEITDAGLSEGGLLRALGRAAPRLRGCHLELRRNALRRGSAAPLGLLLAALRSGSAARLHLGLEGNWLGVRGLEELVDAAAAGPPRLLEHLSLHLGGNGIVGAVGAVLGAAVHRAARLAHSLDVRLPYSTLLLLGGPSAAAFGLPVSVHRLRLDCSACGLDAGTLRALARSLVAASPGLVHLHLDASHNDGAPAALLAELSEPPAPPPLRTLRVAVTGGGAGRSPPLRADALRNLDTLCLRCPLDALRRLDAAAAGPRPPCPIRRLELCLLGVGGVGETGPLRRLSRWMASLPHLADVSVSVRDQPVGDAGARALCGGLHRGPPLARLHVDLSNAALTDAGAAWLGAWCRGRHRGGGGAGSDLGELALDLSRNDGLSLQAPRSPAALAGVACGCASLALDVGDGGLRPRPLARLLVHLAASMAGTRPAVVLRARGGAVDDTTLRALSALVAASGAVVHLDVRDSPALTAPGAATLLQRILPRTPGGPTRRLTLDLDGRLEGRLRMPLPPSVPLHPHRLAFL